MLLIDFCIFVDKCIYIVFIYFYNYNILVFVEIDYSLCIYDMMDIYGI